MRLIALYISLVLLVLSLSYVVFAQDKKPAPVQGFQFGKDPQVQQVKPKRPLRIKVHRTAKGEYTWDITGDNIDDIVRADSRLRKLLKVDQEK